MLMALGGHQHFFHPAGRNAGFCRNRCADGIEGVVTGVLSPYRHANPPASGAANVAVMGCLNLR
jgi:hypothetical protein